MSETNLAIVCGVFFTIFCCILFAPPFALAIRALMAISNAVNGTDYPVWVGWPF